MALIDPNTNRPTLPTLTNEQILQAFNMLQMKLDAINQQLANSCFLTEFVIEKINTFAATQDKGAELTITADEFQTFFEKRRVELAEEWQRTMKAQLNLPEDTEAPVVNLED